jgi:hypothetical protein
MKDLHDEHPGSGHRAEKKLDAVWRTCDEKAFLRWALFRRLPADRPAFLRSYLEAARRRDQWGNVSPRLVLAYIDELFLQAAA